MTLQQKIIDILQGLLNGETSLFRAGYLIYEGTKDDIALFKFLSVNSENQFAMDENNYIPTQYSSFIGKVQPINTVYDEDGTVQLQFALTVDENYVENYSKIENIKRTLAGYSGSFEFENKTYSYSFNSSPIDSSGAPIILNGVRVVLVSLTVFYRLVSGVAMGNITKYYIRPNYVETQDIQNQPNITAGQKASLLLEVEGYDIESELKALILSDITNDIELSVESKELISNLRVEASFEELYRINIDLSVGNILNASQFVNTREMKNIGSNSIFGNILTFYEQEGYFNNVLESLEFGEEPTDKVFVLRVVKNRESGIVTKERKVLIESITPIQDIGKPITKTVTFRVADDLIIDKEIAEKQAEFPEPPLIEFDINYNLYLLTLNGTPVYATNNIANPSTYTTTSDTIYLLNPTTIGHTFNQWLDVTNPLSPTPITQITSGSSGDIDIEIDATPNNYTIIFNMGGYIQTGGDTQVIATYGSDMPTATKPTIDDGGLGLVFGGYYDSDGTSWNEQLKYYDADMNSVKQWNIPANDSLRARWLPPA